MIEGLKSALEEIDARIKRDQAKRKALKKLIHLEEGEAAPQKETERKWDPNKVASEKKVPEKKVVPPSKRVPFDVPFEGHRFIFFSEAYTDKDGKEYPERGWLPVDPAKLRSLYKDCLIKVSDAEDLPLAKDGCNVFKVVEDCKAEDTKVRVVVHD